MTITNIAYADTRWPWRVTATYKDGTVRSEDYSGDFEPVGFAQKLSENLDIVRVEVTTSFIGGEQRSP